MKAVERAELPSSAWEQQSRSDSAYSSSQVFSLWDNF